MKEQNKLDGHGRARREAARRRKSECKINQFQEDEIPLAVMAGRMKKFSENTSTIPEIMDSSTLNFNPNFKFFLRFFYFFLGGGTPSQLGCALGTWSISSAYKNFTVQHPLTAEI